MNQSYTVIMVICEGGVSIVLFAIVYRLFWLTCGRDSEERELSFE